MRCLMWFERYMSTELVQTLNLITIDAIFFKQGIAFMSARNFTSDETWPALLKCKVNYSSEFLNRIRKTRRTTE